MSIYRRRKKLIKNVLEQYDKAIADFNKVIELNPNDAESYSYRGNTYIRQPFDTTIKTLIIQQAGTTTENFWNTNDGGQIIQ